METAAGPLSSFLRCGEHSIRVIAPRRRLSPSCKLLAPRCRRRAGSRAGSRAGGREIRGSFLVSCGRHSESFRERAPAPTPRLIRVIREIRGPILRKKCNPMQKRLATRFISSYNIRYLNGKYPRMNTKSAPIAPISQRGLPAVAGPEFTRPGCRVRRRADWPWRGDRGGLHSASKLFSSPGVYPPRRAIRRPRSAGRDLNLESRRPGTGKNGGNTKFLKRDFLAESCRSHERQMNPNFSCSSRPKNQVNPVLIFPGFLPGFLASRLSPQKKCNKMQNKACNAPLDFIQPLDFSIRLRLF